MPHRHLRLVWMVVLLASMTIASQTAWGDRIEQQLPSSIGDLQQVQVMEVRDNSGVVALTGKYATKEDDSDELEREAPLRGRTGYGKAEIEISKKNGQVVDQELEVELKELTPNTPYKIFFDKKEVFSLTSDKKGKADLKLSTKIKSK